MQKKMSNFLSNFLGKRAVRFNVLVSVPVVLSACLENNSSFEFLDAKSSTADQKDCKITNSSPDQESIKVSALAGNKTDFLVGVSNSICQVSYQLDGVALEGTDPARSVESSQLVAGNNILIASSGSTSKKWILTKYVN